jgi:hypothetical protein
MIKKHIGLFILLATLATGFSCSKTHKPEDDIPQISIVEVKPATVQQFKDSIIITISYTDGNGDLGDYNPDGKTLKIQDARLKDPDYYHIAPLAPAGAEIRIDGTLKIKISSLFILGSGEKENTTLALSIRDRAGNWSNVAITQQITISN